MPLTFVVSAAYSYAYLMPCLGAMIGHPIEHVQTSWLQKSLAITSTRCNPYASEADLLEIAVWQVQLPAIGKLHVQGYFLKAKPLVHAWIPREFAVPTYHLPAMPSSDPYSLIMLKLRRSLWKCLEYTYRAVRVTARIRRVYLVEHRQLILNYKFMCILGYVSLRSPDI